MTFKGILVGAVVAYIFLQRNPQYLKTEVLVGELRRRGKDLATLIEGQTQPAPLGIDPANITQRYPY